MGPWGTVGRFAWRAAVPVLVAVALANLLFGRAGESDPLQRAAAAAAAGDHGIAKNEYAALIREDFFEIRHHRGYIASHFNLPKRTGRSSTRDDGPVFAAYGEYSRGTDPRVRDIGFYVLGYAFSSAGRYAEALPNFEAVHDRTLPFLHNSLGFVQERVGHHAAARGSYLREIRAGGNVEGATGNLANLLFETGETGDLRRLLAEPRAREHVSGRIVRAMAWKDQNVARYLREALWVPVRPAGLIAATTVLALWLLYIRRIDLFEPEPWSGVLLAVAGGAAFSFLTTELYDVLDFGLGFRLRGTDVNDLLFCVFGIGLVEETVKAVPVLLLIRFSRFVNESVDYLVYGSLTGLGFAFVENLQYFQDDGLHRITGRALSAAVLHMILTSLVAYGILYARHHRGHGSWRILAFTFASACVLHGLYDFFLVSEGVFSNFGFVSFYLLLFALFRYQTALRCALNVSEHNRWRGTALVDLTVQLGYGMTALFVLQYLLTAWKYGAYLANRSLLLSSFEGLFLVMWLLFLLGSFSLRQKEWEDAIPVPAWLLRGRGIPDRRGAQH